MIKKSFLEIIINRNRKLLFQLLKMIAKISNVDNKIPKNSCQLKHINKSDKSATFIGPHLEPRKNPVM